LKKQKATPGKNTMKFEFPFFKKDEAKKDGVVLEFKDDPMVDAILDKPEIVSHTNIRFDVANYEGRELEPGHKLVFLISQQFKGRIVKDVILRHRKGEKYRKDMGPDHRDPYGAYSLVELHDLESDQWVGWRDPKGYDPVKFAEPRSASDPENEVLHDWIATVGKVTPDAVKITNVGLHPKWSTSQIHGLEVVFFPELEDVSYENRIYSEGTKFIDLEKNELLPSYGGGSNTEGVYRGALVLNSYRATLYETRTDPGPGAELEHSRLKIKLKPDQSLAQVEVAVGDTEHLKEISPKTGRKTRLGYSKLWVGLKRAKTGETEWFVKNANIAPQCIISGAPGLKDNNVENGDELIIEARDDAAYIMGWRVAYKNTGT
jgi:hypothetical protein